MPRLRLQSTLGYAAGNPTAQWEVALLAGSAIALSCGAWYATATLPTRRRVALVLAVLMPHYYLLREIFVRWDVWRGEYFALAAGVAIIIPWGRPHRWLGVACASTLALGSLVAIAQPLGGLFSPVTRAHDFAREAKQTLLASDRRLVFQYGHETVGMAGALSPAALAAVRGHCVSVEAYEIALVWQYSLHWCPVPALQSYAAYTKPLDQLDAAHYADARHGPDRVVRSTVPAIDGRLSSWESPAAFTALYCHFVDVVHDPTWEVLARVPDRCGKPRTIAVLHSTLGGTVTLPNAAPGTALVVKVQGLGVAGKEALASALWSHAAVRTIVVDGRPVRVVPGTAGDGLLMSVPPQDDYPAPYQVGWQEPITMQATIGGRTSGAITYRVEQVPVRASAPPPD